MKRTYLVCTLVSVLILALSLLAGTTGKITGVVTDATTKEPMQGVSVAVVGTTMGAKTDAEGRYTILNVPVGTYVLKFTSVGFTSVEVSDVSVSVDLASYQDQALSQSVTQLDNVIKVTAEQSLLIKDKTSSMNIVKKDELDALPVRGLDQVVSLQNSAVKARPFSGLNIRGDREAINGSEINLRGGRPSEVAYYVDGFSTQDPLTGISTANVANNAVQEISIQSGGFPAEYGGVTSGIINTTTNSGHEILTGSVGIRTDNITGNSANQNWYSADVSGPIPQIERMYFSVAAERRWLGDRDPHATTDDYLPSGNFGLPNNSLSGWSYSGKIDYSFTPSVKLSVTGSGSRDEWREYTHSYLFNSEHMPYYEDRNLGLNGRFTHTLNAKTFYNVSVSYSQIRRFRGDGVHQKNLSGYGRSTNPDFDESDLFWLGGHVYDDFLRRRSEYVGLKWDIESRVGEYHTMKLGLEGQRHTLRYYRHLQPVNVFDSNYTDLDRYGYDEFGNLTNDEGANGLDGPKHPINFAAFLQDRFEWRGMIVNAGLRFDFFDYNAKRIKNLASPFDPDEDGDPNSGVLDDGDLEDSEKFTRISPRLGISFPVSDATKLHFNYGKFFQRPDLQYLYVGYQYYDFKVRKGGYYYPMGNPNLKPEKTTAFEIGFEHLMNENTRLAVTAYLKDLSDQIQVYKQATVGGNAKEYETYQNSDYGTVKGIEFELEMRRSRNVALNVKYSLQYAEGTGSYAATARNSAWTGEDAPKQSAALDYDQRHKLTGNIDWRLGRGQGPAIGSTHPLENFGINVLLNLGSGLPYSPAEVYNEITLANVAPNPSATRNSAYGPWTFTIDLKASRAFKIGRYSISPYIEIHNLLDRENAVGVYESSGRPDATGYLETASGQTAAADTTPNEFGYSFAESYRIKEQNPLNYGSPRMIFIGATASF